VRTAVRARRHILGPVSRSVASVVAIAAVAFGVGIALLLPMYTCMDPYEFEDIQGPGAGPTCIVSDMGYRPRSWLPTKIAIAAAGVAAAAFIVLWTRKRRMAATGVVVAFIVVAAMWFILT
jgi:hypothetical protein